MLTASLAGVGSLGGCTLPSSPNAREVTPDADDPRVWLYTVPPTEQFNGSLVVWCPSIQYATSPVGLPVEFSEIPDLTGLINGLGFAFAVRAYSTNGFAIDQNIEDVREMVDIYTEREGAPEKVFLIGASGGGLVATLLLERYPEEFAGGLSACGPLGDFQQQIEYLLDARATFNVYFPGVIPGDPFDPPADLVEDWAGVDDDQGFVFDTLFPALLDPSMRESLYEWVKVARLPYDPEDAVSTMAQSAETVLSFTVLNIQAAKEYLGGLPYSNIDKEYSGSKDDAYLNATVPRIDGDAEVAQFVRENFSATGDLTRPLMTIHTTNDPLVPYWHETQYTFKHFMNAPIVPKRIHLRVERYGHCYFEPTEPLLMFALLLLYDGDLELIRSALGGVIDIDSAGLIRTDRIPASLPSQLMRKLAPNRTD